MGDQSIWTFTVVAALVTTAGTLTGHLLKDVVLAAWFESWKQRAAIRAVYRRYRDPIIVAALETARRLDEVVDEWDDDTQQVMRTDVLDDEEVSPDRSLERTPYYCWHKCCSTLYRFAALLGWIELQRQDLTFMDAGHADGERARDIDIAFHNLREAMANGEWVDAALENDAIAPTHDAILMRDEQRAIGEAMIDGGRRTVIGYASFIDLIDATSPSARERWLGMLKNFLLDLEPAADFRRERFRRLTLRLFDLVAAIDIARVSEHDWATYRRLATEQALVDAGRANGHEAHDVIR